MQPKYQNEKSESHRFSNIIQKLRAIWLSAELRASEIEREQDRLESYQSNLCKYARLQLQSRF